MLSSPFSLRPSPADSVVPVQCLRTSLEAVEEAKELMQFVDDADHRIVDTGFYQSIAAINGQVKTNRQTDRPNRYRCAALKKDELGRAQQPTAD